MTDDRERSAALMAVAHTLTAQERTEFLAKAAQKWPRLVGADVADVLDMTTDHDMFLDKTEPFYDQHTDELPETSGNIFALHALIILDRPLRVGTVLRLLQRAGLTDRAADQRLTDEIVAEVAGTLMNAWGLAHCSEATAPVLPEQLARQLAFQAMARLCTIRDRDGIDPLPH